MPEAPMSGATALACGSALSTGVSGALAPAVPTLPQN